MCSFVGRGINFPIALEGALKLKEIAYIHAEGYAAGELKHGPFALLTPDTPVVALAARDNTYATLLANIKEIKARESPVIAVAEEGDEEIEKYVDFVIRVPRVDHTFSPVVNAVALQLLAYHAAVLRRHYVLQGLGRQLALPDALPVFGQPGSSLFLGGHPASGKASTYLPSFSVCSFCAMAGMFSSKGSASLMLMSSKSAIE
jgi:hypothetical protein